MEMWREKEEKWKRQGRGREEEGRRKWWHS